MKCSSKQVQKKLFLDTVPTAKNKISKRLEKKGVHYGILDKGARKRKWSSTQKKQAIIELKEK